jgi:hypothetical protein
MAKEQQQEHYILYLCLCLCLYHVQLREVMQPVAEPDELEDFGTVLVLVLVLVQMQVCKSRYRSRWKSSELLSKISWKVSVLCWCWYKCRCKPRNRWRGNRGLSSLVKFW